MEVESSPTFKFYLTKDAIIKWTKIVGLCSLFSFVMGGVAIEWSVVPMILGVLTIILFYSLIESYPHYSSLKKKNDRFKRAVDLGIKIRCIYAILTPLIGVVDLFVGAIAVQVTYQLTTISLEASSAPVSMADDNFFLYQIAVYIATLVTGFIHSILLAILCGFLYFLLPYLPVRKKNEQ